MAELKTKKNDRSVEAFLNTIVDKQKKADSKTMVALMEEITKSKPKMWGSNIIGFGDYIYKYKTGRMGEWFLMGFSPRKQSLSLYLMSGIDQFDNKMQDLGKFKTGKGCLYIKKLEDIDMKVLKDLLTTSMKHLQNKPTD